MNGHVAQAATLRNPSGRVIERRLAGPMRARYAPPMPTRLHAAAAKHRALVGQMLRFGVVGLIGYAIDTATVYALRGALGLYAAGLVSFFVAASGNWAMHRAWTFRGRGRVEPVHRQWLTFLAANALGFVLNRGAYAALVASSALCVRYPFLATAGGAVAGMGVNFVMSRQVVFRAAA